MSLARTAAESMLSDALLPDQRGPRLKGLHLELPMDRMVKFVAVGVPLLLVSLTFAQELSAGSQINCFSPGNFSVRQASYVDGACWDSLVHHEWDAAGNHKTKSLWAHKALPYSLLALALVMYLPGLLWRFAAAPALSSDLLFIISELDKSYNRSIRLVQHLVKIRQKSPDPYAFWDELDRARGERYFEYPLLERYLACKQRSHSLVAAHLLRNSLLLLFGAAACLYLASFHLDIFFQEEFGCSVKEGLLRGEAHVPRFIPCRLTAQSVFQAVSVSLAVAYALLAPVIGYNLARLCRWDQRLLAIYEMLPAFDLLSRKMLGCPVNDLNLILLFLHANISELVSFGRLSALSVLKDVAPQKQHIDTVVDFMTLLAGLEPWKPRRAALGEAGGHVVEMGGSGESPPGPETPFLGLLQIQISGDDADEPASYDLPVGLGSERPLLSPGFQLVTVKATSSEYSLVKDTFLPTMADFTILSAQRNQNRSLWSAFQKSVTPAGRKTCGKSPRSSVVREEQMKSANNGKDVEEKLLFHKAEPSQVNHICQGNFDWTSRFPAFLPALARTNAQGCGHCLFSLHATNSHQSCGSGPKAKVMFLARVLVGNFTQGQPPLACLLPLSGDPSRAYDSCMDSLATPSLIAVFEKHQVYPEFVIKYTEAKKCVILCEVDSCAVCHRNCQPQTQLDPTGLDDAPDQA
ncbi:LOW QUALITY PROTEIN: pannexin-3 [Tachyglossus aculeatus]|uniref:LOW QUALITY PROTEIN: pannexin-3 n=1 Tax=Tachyglossus aculeatus TaxID=9261 RepID=UPI0018F463F6|nr:LOW QUALITY PROTEIN: pannexin-3 [Tachyglossus aculeatus]